MVRHLEEHGDLIFWFTVLSLSLFGVLMVYSASSVAAFEQLGDSFYLFRKQFFFFLAGLFVMMVASKIHPDTWLKASPVLMAAAVVGLLLVHVPGLGHRSGGAARWIAIGSFTIQPSEFVKLFAVLFFAKLLGKKKPELLETFQFGVLPVVLFTGVLGLGMMLQPDFGNTIILFSVAMVSLFLAKVKIRHLVYLFLLALPMALLLILSAGYRRRRLEAFLDPWADPTSASYQILQSFSAFSSGGVFGKGLGNSQEKLFFLPKVHTDFIASVVGEELGILGILVLCVGFAFIVWYAFDVASRSTQKTHYLMVSVLGFMLGLQAFLNFCVVLGLAPTKGLPMPFISYGGSSLVVAFWACGLIQSVARLEKRSFV